MNKETFSIEVEYYGDKLRLELPSSISISDFYYKLDTIAHFLTFQNQSIENVYVNRANEINNFEVHESIKELNQEIDTLENKIIELEDELKNNKILIKTKKTEKITGKVENFTFVIDELNNKAVTLYEELQEKTNQLSTILISISFSKNVPNDYISILEQHGKNIKYLESQYYNNQLVEDYKSEIEDLENDIANISEYIDRLTN